MARGKSGNNQNQPKLAPHVNSSSSGNQIFADFLKISKLLNDRHARVERLEKLSSDITVQSKSIISMIHSAVNSEQSKGEVYAKARELIQVVIQGPIKAIALELENALPYAHAEAVSAGLQEIIKAQMLLSLLENNDLLSKSDADEQFVFTVKSDDGKERQISTLIPYPDFMLSVANVTDELALRVMYSVSSGDHEECSKVIRQIQNIYCGTLGLIPDDHNKELVDTMIKTIYANVLKVENINYPVMVCGDEEPVELSLMPLQLDEAKENNEPLKPLEALVSMEPLET